MRRRAGLAVAMLASTLLLAAGASPASAAVGRAYVANFGSDTVSVVDLATNTLVTTIAVGDGPVDVAVTPDGSRAYVVNDLGRSVSVIDTASNTVVATVAMAQYYPRAVTISPDGRQAWVSGQRGGIRIIDVASNTLVGDVPTVAYANDVAFTPDGARAYVVSGGEVLAVDTATYAVVAFLSSPGHGNTDVEVSPDGTRVYVLDSMDMVFVYDTATNARSDIDQYNYGTEDLTVSPDGARLYITRGNPAALLVVDAATLAVVATVPLDFSPWGVDVSPAGDRLYVSMGDAGNQGRLAVVDTATNSVVAAVAVGVEPRGLAVTPSGVAPPPPGPVIEGATFYTDGTSSRSGVAPGARIAVFTSSGVPGVAYRLVLSREGCRTVLAVLNANARFANASGVIGSTGGTIPPGTPPGRYHVCFRAPVGSGSTITAPVTLDVV